MKLLLKTFASGLMGLGWVLEERSFLFGTEDSGYRHRILRTFICFDGNGIGLTTMIMALPSE